jgi:hypothetical protein
MVTKDEVRQNRKLALALSSLSDVDLARWIDDRFSDAGKLRLLRILLTGGG